MEEGHQEEEESWDSFKERLKKLNSDGNHLMDEGNYAAAAEIHRKCMEERRNMLGDQHHFTLQSMNNLALCCQHLREYSQSEALLKHCVSANRERYGESYSETVIAMNNLALLYHHQARELGFIGDIASERLQQALILYEECLKLFDYTPPSSRSSDERVNTSTGSSFDAVYTQYLTLSILHNCAGIYQDQKNFEDALFLYQDCLQQHKKHMSSAADDDINVMRTNSHYRELLNVMNSLASCHHSCLEVKIEREKEQEKVEDIISNGREQSYRYDGDMDAREAIRLYTECLHERQIVLGENHPDTLLTAHNLAGVYITIERFELAAPLLVQAFSKRLIVLGENHPETLVSMFCLGMLYDKEADAVVHGHHSRDRAKELYETCLEKRCQVLGESHPETVRVRNVLTRLKLNKT